MLLKLSLVKEWTDRCAAVVVVVVNVCFYVTFMHQPLYEQYDAAG